MTTKHDRCACTVILFVCRNEALEAEFYAHSDHRPVYAKGKKPSQLRFETTAQDQQRKDTTSLTTYRSVCWRRNFKRIVIVTGYLRRDVRR